LGEFCVEWEVGVCAACGDGEGVGVGGLGQERVLEWTAEDGWVGAVVSVLGEEGAAGGAVSEGESAGGRGRRGLRGRRLGIMRGR
jgi:hypothetical protein